MTCIITVKGDGRGKYGKPKNDRTGPLETFLVDNQHFYPIVFRHLQSCDKHSPNGILEYYLRRRLNQGKPMVTETLVKLALKYDRHFKIDRALLNEYKWRLGIHEYEYREGLSLHDVAKAMRLQMATGYVSILDRAVAEAPDAAKLSAIFSAVTHYTVDEVLNMPKDSQLEKLIAIAEVMAT